MLHCQQCGAGNSDDAVFCNQCGGKIAQPGEPGGPLSAPDAKPESTMVGHGEARSAAKREAARVSSPPESSSSGAKVPPPSGEPSMGGLDVSTISLSAIGVRSRGKAWGVLIGVVLLLMTLGATAMWLILTNADRTPPAVAENDLPLEPQPPIELGEPVPQGTEPPVDFVPGVAEPRPRDRGTRPPRTPGPAGSPRETTGSGTPNTGSGSGTPASTGSGSGTPASTGSGSGTPASTGSGSGTPAMGSGSTGSTGSTGSGSTGTGSTGSGSTGTGSTGSGSTPSTGSTGSSGAPDWEALEEEEPVDREMEAYAARVRGVIRQYYLPRAQSCFEFASRNNESVRGTILVAFEIQADGNVDDSRVERNTTGIESLGGCLARQVGSWRLPPPPEAPLAMSMPFSR